MKLTNQQRRAIYRFYREEMGYTAKEAANARNRPFLVFHDWRREYTRLKALNKGYRAEKKPTIPLPKKPAMKLTREQRASVRGQMKIAGVPRHIVSEWSRLSETKFIQQKARLDGLKARIRAEKKNVKEYLRDLEKVMRGVSDDEDFWDRFQTWYLETVGVRLTKIY